MRRALVLLVCAAPVARAPAQTRPDSAALDRKEQTTYDALNDSTTRSLSAYAVVDTSVTPPDTFAVELSQRWRGRGTTAPVGAVELGLGRTRAEGLRGGGRLLGIPARRPPLVFVLDGTRRIRLEQTEYVSDGGRVITFETARYALSAAELRRIAEAREVRLRVGERELWLDPAWRSVAAEMVAGQRASGGGAPPNDDPPRPRPMPPSPGSAPAPSAPPPPAAPRRT